MRQHLHDLGEAEVKHGVRIHVVNYVDGRVGNPSAPEKLSDAQKPVIGKTTNERPLLLAKGAKVVLIYKRNAEPDGTLLRSLEQELLRIGCEVFIDRHLRVGLEWAREIERAIKNADAVIPLLSPAARLVGGRVYATP